MRQVGAMEQAYQDFKDIAAVYIVYISEAHASDDKYPVGYAKEMGISEHKNFGERCAVAARLVADKKLTIPCLVDNMDNAAEKAYQGWPDRVYLIGKDGKLAVAGHRGPWGFKPALEAAVHWLSQYKETGVEPAPVQLKDTMGEYRKLSRKMNQAYESGDYDKAIGLAEDIQKLRPKDDGAMYNLACFHCLAGHKEQAYAWLEKSIEAGWDDADHMLKDDDFKSIRNEERFRKLADSIGE
ncbi:MAG: deiodinase-like protein [Phycisphaerae bacterium]